MGATDSGPGAACNVARDLWFTYTHLGADGIVSLETCGSLIETELAVYAFPPEVDLESELVLVYGFDQTDEWSGILPRIQAERARARARATGAP